MQNTGLKEADNATQLQFSFSSTPTVNNWIFVGCGMILNAAASPPNVNVADNQGNTYTRIEHSPASPSITAASIHYGKATTSSGTFTFTVTPDSGTGYYACAAIEWDNSGVAITADQSTGNDAIGVTSGNTGTTGATTSANELVLAVISPSANDPNNNISTPASSGYTSLAVEPNTQAHAGIEFSYKTVAATGTQTASWTFDSSNYTAVIGTFTIQVSTGPPTGTLNLLGVGK